MNTATAGRSGCMSNMSTSIDITQTDTSALSHVALANHTLGQEGLLHSDCANLPSYPEHGKVPYLQKICAECLTSFSTNSNLEQHASNSGHTAFSCTCGQQFSRAYTLTRHINSMIGPSFPCELCDNKAFPRLDKLSDHLRRWHRLGVKAFDQYKGGDSPTKPATNSVALPIGGGIAPLQAGVFGQAYHVAPAFEPVSMFNGFPSASSTTPEALSTESSASLGIYTGADNWWYSQPGHNTAYPALA